MPVIVWLSHGMKYQKPRTPFFTSLFRINPKVSVIDSIDLREGPATSLTLVSVIASNVNASSGSYRWDIPRHLDPGSDCKLSLREFERSDVILSYLDRCYRISNWK